MRQKHSHRRQRAREREAGTCGREVILEGEGAHVGKEGGPGMTRQQAAYLELLVVVEEEGRRMLLEHAVARHLSGEGKACTLVDAISSPHVI